MLLLLDPPFDRSAQDPGYIKGYPPGVRENGGQYTHAAVWIVMALAQLGSGDEAAEFFHMLNPINHSRTAADVGPLQDRAVRDGRRRLRAARRTPDAAAGAGTPDRPAGCTARASRASSACAGAATTFVVDPCIPLVVARVPDHLALPRQPLRDHRVATPARRCRGVAPPTLDGAPVDAGAIPLVDDGRTHDGADRSGLSVCGSFVRAMRVLTSTDSHVSRGRTIQHLENRILAALPPDEFLRLAPHLTLSPLTYKHVITKAGEPIRDVCFPDSGVCSVVSVMRSGATAEVGTIGNEGVTGVALFFGDLSEPSESVIQVPGAGRMLPASVFQCELARRGPLHRLVGHYAHALMIQVMQSAACNALHSIEQRTCKWLLMTHDRVFTDEFLLTQEFLAMMLGVARPGVSAVAKKLSRAGLIRYSRGQVTVLDRKGLEAGSCECYAIVSRVFDAFLHHLEHPDAGVISPSGARASARATPRGRRE